MDQHSQPAAEPVMRWGLRTAAAALVWQGQPTDACFPPAKRWGRRTAAAAVVLLRRGQRTGAGLSPAEVLAAEAGLSPAEVLGELSSRQPFA